MLGKTVITAFIGLASLVAAEKCPVADVSAIRHTGETIGEEITYNGLTLYVTKPKGWSAGCNTTQTGVLYLTDVFGIQLAENKLFARAGYISVAPDLFDGKPAPEDINVPGFNTTQFLAEHGPEVTDPLVANAVEYLRKELGVAKVAVTGYCFGGRYTFRELAPGKGADVGFAAHPSLLTDDEIKAIVRPASVAAAQNDNLMPAARRAEIEALLGETGQPFSLALYGGTEHGFGVRANVSDPQQKFGKEEAFFQAVRFFDTWA